MKGSIIIFIGAAVCLASAVPVEDASNYALGNRTYSRFIKFPDGEGNMHDVDLEAEPNWDLVNEVTRNPNNNRYLLFTRRNRRTAQTLTMNNINSVRSSNFNANVPTVVVVHGWLSSRYTEPNPTIRDAYLDKSDVNVIVMDWSRLSRTDYVTATAGVPGVGRGLGEFLVWLSSNTGAALNNMHLAGFSLGAHVVGNAGRATNGRVARVTGLDPAGPLWNVNRNRLKSGDGVYVEAIHTDGGYLYGGLGIGTAIVDADFFPNGGISQPGCITNFCNHNRAWELFAATVTRNHLVGRQCANTLQITWDNCRGSQLRMGNDDLRKTGSGMYRLNTGRRYPF